MAKTPKTLTAAGVEKMKPDPGKRLWVRDAGSQALYLVIQQSGFKSWAMAFRKRGRDGVERLFLGPLDLSGRRPDGEPVIGQPLTLVAARRLAAKINSDRAAGVDVVGRHRTEKHERRVALVEASVSTFAAVARDFVVEHARPKTRGWVGTARSLGLDDDLSIRPGSLADRWRDRDVKTVSASDLFSVIEEARRIGAPGVKPRHDGPSEARSRKLHAALSQMLSWALRQRRIEANPIAAIHPPSVPKGRDRVLTNAEIRSFWAASDALKEPLGGVLRLLLLTGARLNEIARLRWDEVSEDGTTLTISSDRVKNGRAFVLPLAPKAQAIVAAMPRVGAHVFSVNSIRPVVIGSAVKVQLDAVMGADVAPWVVHDLRRTCATHMAEIGVQPHIVEACLNHVSGHKAGVAGTYNRAAYSQEKRAALELWADRVETIVSGEPARVVPIRSRP
jgi:integrase